MSVLLHGPLPSRVAQVEKVSCSSRHCVAVSRLGVVFTWGNGSEGALGHGDFEDTSRPRVVEYFLRRTSNEDEKTSPSAIVTESAGSCKDGSHTACITNEGELFMFGLGTSCIIKTHITKTDINRRRKTQVQLSVLVNPEMSTYRDFLTRKHLATNRMIFRFVYLVAVASQ